MSHITLTEGLVNTYTKSNFFLSSELYKNILAIHICCIVDDFIVPGLCINQGNVSMQYICMLAFEVYYCTTRMMSTLYIGICNMFVINLLISSE